MLSRCRNERTRAYQWYGGRGIQVCEEWENDFENFFNEMGHRPPGYKLDRIDNDGNYEPGNCRWATQLEQVRNSRKLILSDDQVAEAKVRVANGETHLSVAQDMGVARVTITNIVAGRRRSEGDMSDVLKPEDLEDLPEELRSELKISSADSAAFELIEAIKDHAPNPGSFNIDRAQIAWYRRTGNVTKRTSMQNRLSAMARKELLVAHGNGVYGLREQDMPRAGVSEAAE